MTKTSAWAALGWTVALNVVWAAAMTAATLFLVVLGAVVDVFADEASRRPTGSSTGCWSRSSSAWPPAWR